jgi:hypothetical protein
MADEPADDEANKDKQSGVTPPVKGMFKLVDGERGDQFNLMPRDDRVGAIPEDQRKISYELYEARNILKLLQEQCAFKSDDAAKKAAKGSTDKAGDNTAKSGVAGSEEDVKTA